MDINNITGLAGGLILSSILLTALVVRTVVYNMANKYWESYWREMVELDNKWEAGNGKVVAERLALRKLKLKVHSPMRKVIMSVFLVALYAEILWYVPKFLSLAANWLGAHIK